MGKDTKIGLLVGVLVVVLFALVFFGGGGGTPVEEPPEAVTPEPGVRVADTADRTTDTETARRTDHTRVASVDASRAAPRRDEGRTEGLDPRTDEHRGEVYTLRTRPVIETGPTAVEERRLDPVPAASVAGKVYEVKSGDSYYLIAKAEYGSAALWPVIKAANDNQDPLRPGMKIVIPPKPAEITVVRPTVGSAAAVTPLAANQHEVQPNDSLWKIAAKHFGDGSKFMLIYEANKDKLKSPDATLTVGMRLTLPARDAALAARTAAASTGETRTATASTAAPAAGATRTTRRPTGGRPADID